MYVATNRITVAKGHADDLAELFRNRGGVRQQPGFISFELWQLRSDDENEEILVVTHWESEEAQRNWVRSDAFREAHSGPHPDFIRGPGQFSAYDVMFRYEAEG